MDTPNSGFLIFYPIPQAGHPWPRGITLSFFTITVDLPGLGFPGVSVMAVFLLFFAGFFSLLAGFVVCAETPTASKLAINNVGIFIIVYFSYRIYNKRSNIIHIMCIETLILKPLYPDLLLFSLFFVLFTAFYFKNSLKEIYNNKRNVFITIMSK
jgi:uncharacterized membrane protein YqgA involved in biofilm formation